MTGVWPTGPDQAVGEQGRKARCALRLGPGTGSGEQQLGRGWGWGSAQGTVAPRTVSQLGAAGRSPTLRTGSGTRRQDGRSAGWLRGQRGLRPGDIRGRAGTRQGRWQEPPRCISARSPRDGGREPGASARSGPGPAKAARLCVSSRTASFDPAF